jgi:hypothetical protein
MRDFRDAKTMAHTLRSALKVKAVEITYSDCLELIAKAFGFDNWNVLSAKIIAGGSTVEETGSDPKQSLHCSFCGKSQHEVRKLIAGPTAFICDGCVKLCVQELRAIDRVLSKTANDND